MNGAEYIPPEIRERHAEQEAPDNGEDQPVEFKNDGWGYCQHCGLAKSFHVGGGPGPVYCTKMRAE